MEKIKTFLFSNNNTKQTVIKNTFWLFVSEFGMRILKLVIFVYATRKLGVSEWGLFSYALAIMGFFSLLTDIGVNSVILRETAKNNQEKNNYIATGFSLKLFLSIFSSLLLLSLMWILPASSSIKNLIPITALLLFIDAIREFGFSLNRALEKMELEAFIRISTTALLVILGFVFLKQEASGLYLFYAYLCASIVGVLVMYLMLSKYFKNIYRDFKKSLLIPLWKESWPIGVATGLGALMANTDTIILGWFESTEQIGIYSTAQKLIQIVYLVPILISTAMLPAFARIANTNPENLRLVIKKMIRYSGLFTIPLIVICLLSGDFVFDLLFGTAYKDSVLIFQIMSLAVISIVPSAILSNALFALGKQKKLIPFISLSVFLNILLCLITIPYYGILGAAFSMLIAYTLGNYVLIVRYNNLFK